MLNFEENFTPFVREKQEQLDFQKKGSISNQNRREIDRERIGLHIQGLVHKNMRDGKKIKLTKKEIRELMEKKISAGSIRKIIQENKELFPTWLLSKKKQKNKSNPKNHIDSFFLKSKKNQDKIIMEDNSLFQYFDSI